MSALMGLLAKDWPRDKRRNALSSMALTLKGRGGEPFAAWTLEGEPVALGIRELVTRDLTPDGRQPALSVVKPVAVILDGVISNAAVIRRDLEEAGIRPRGHGDAELLAEAVAQFGLNRTLQRLEGAFAFALWDGEAQALHLVRDRMGAKNLCVTRAGGATAFASSPDAFEGLEGYAKRLDSAGVPAYLACGYTEGTASLLKDVVLLPPGHRLMLRADDTAIPAPERWWNPATALEEIALRGTPPLKPDRILGLLAAEAAALDVPFSILDDGSLEARNLVVYLGQKAEKLPRGLILSVPDAVSVQTTLETVSALPFPTADPDACILAHTLKHSPEMAGTVLFAPCQSGMRGETSEATPRFAVPRTLRHMAAKLMPSHFAHLATNEMEIAEKNFGYWPWKGNPAGEAFAPYYEKPRLFLPAEDSALILGLEPLRRSRLPMLDAVGGFYNTEIRLPMADHRMLEHQIPTFTRSKADIAAWMRGPLRIRMQNTLNNMYFEMLQIKRSDVIISGWQNFLAGNNTNAHGLWAWLTLCSWIAAQKVT